MGGSRYRRLAEALKERFGQRVHKVTLRGGFGCPNRDGRLGTGGCLFCSETALLPPYEQAFGPVDVQLASGLEAIQRRHGAQLALAYFQDGTATDAPAERLTKLFGHVLSHPRVAALAIGTRPDWIDDSLYDRLAELARIKPVFLELGLQIANDRLLKAMNRNHTVDQFEQSVRRAHERAIEVVAHVILDLPGTTDSDRDETARCLNRLGVEGVKIHNLHILRGTPLAEVFARREVSLSSFAEYVAMATRFLERLDPAMVVHRLTGEGPQHLMLAPDWVRHKAMVLRAIERTLEISDGWQGKLAPPDAPSNGRTGE